MRRGAWAILVLISCTARAEDAPQRPAIEFNRWQEDWSVLADPAVSREPLDALKYIPLDPNDPKTYLSFGLDLRERFEANNSFEFGLGGVKPQSYVISRLEGHADLWIADQLQAFVQILSAFAPGKSFITPVDQDRLDLEQAFLALTEPVNGGELKFRVGRQQIAFDLQRFISVRDGPNVRQSYDALWGAFIKGSWHVTGFFSEPVQDRDLRDFDDYSNSHLTYGGLRVERKLGDLGSVAVTLSRYTQDDARYPSITGNERRNIADVHFSGTKGALDWDWEVMGQKGSIANKSIDAWAFGSRTGYTFQEEVWTPELGFQADAASGNRNAHGGTLGTFNPLFPNGYYVTLSGYTGYTNFVHLKPMLTLHPETGITLLFALAGQWRESTADAVYTQPILAVPGTAGHGGGYTGNYVQIRLDWQLTPNLSTAIEAVRFNVGSAISSLGGHAGNYVGVEGKFGW